MRTPANRIERSTLATLLAMITLLVTAPRVLAKPFHSETGHYTIDLPEGWTAVPTQQAMLLGLHLPVVVGGPISVDASFLPADPTGASPVIACIVIESYPGGQAPPIIFRTQTATDPAASTPQSNLQTLSVDNKAHTFHETQKLPLFAGLTLQAEAHGWLGSQSLATFCTAATGPIAEKYGPDFNHIAASFQFDKGYAPSRPDLLFPSLALAAIAAAVTWVARRSHAANPPRHP